MAEALKHLSDVFNKHSEDHAIICDETKLTYRQLYSHAATFAKWFHGKGVSHTDAVAVELYNSIDFVLCYLAGALGGFRIVPINPLSPEFQRNYILKHTRPRMVVSQKDTLPTIENNQDINPEFQFDFDPTLVFYTSGTTSTPKGVCHSFERMVANVMAFNQLVGINEDTRMLHVMPMSYMAGFLNTILSPIAAGGSVVLAPVFSADMARNFWPHAMKNRVNATWLSPTMLALLSRLNRSREVTEWTMRNMRHVFVGTAPLPPIIKENFENTFGVECLESYGMTEILLVSCNTKDTACRNTSVGKLLSRVEVKTREQNGTDLANGRTGELWIKSPYSLIGYIGNRPDEMLRPLQDGWFATGDFGFLDANGELFITGRIKDLIIHGGVNVSPRAVEEVLMAHQNVRDAVVLSVPHEFWGEEVVAFVMQDAGAQLDLKSLKKYCEARLNPDAVPGKYIVLNEFPRTETGKVKKDALREFL